MIKNILFFILLAMPFTLAAQCKDSTMVDQYHPCGANGYSYNPVCGCDNVTYRNECAAQYWGGIINAQLGLNYTQGVCGNFDFDFAPNPIGRFSGGNSDSHLHIYVNSLFNSSSSGISYSVYLFDVFNKVVYQRDAVATSSDNIIQGNAGDNGIPIGDFSSAFFGQLENGVYLLIVSVNGEQKTKKIIVENPN
jgi:hypothetical protein